MTCKELIEKLKEFDEDAVIRVADDELEYAISDVVEVAGDVCIEFDNEKW